jgi:orotidine-5'-phosphate decarboxylase
MEHIDLKIADIQNEMAEICRALYGEGQQVYSIDS